MIDQINAAWDEHQQLMIELFYGNEEKAKKPLPLYHTKNDSIIVPGLAGMFLSARHDIGS